MYVSKTISRDKKTEQSFSDLQSVIQNEKLITSKQCNSYSNIFFQQILGVPVQAWACHRAPGGSGSRKF